MAEITMSLEEYESLRAMALSGSCINCNSSSPPAAEAPPSKRKPSAYNRRFSRAFKKVESKYKKKNGGWKKNGFRSAQREAHRIAKRG